MFQSTTKDNKDLIIGLIYSNNCIHCQMLMPQWTTMKKNIQKKYGKKYPFFLEFEANELNKLEEYNEKNKNKMNGKIEYSGFPTIFKISGGNIEYYDGDRDAKVMEYWFIPTKNDNYTSIDIDVKGGKKYKKTIELKTKSKRRKHCNLKKRKTKKQKNTKK